MKNPILAAVILALPLTAALTYANTERHQQTGENPLDGKVVLINPTSRSTPRSGVRIEDLGGKNFLVYPVSPKAVEPYESWMAVEDISTLRVFRSTEDAEAYLARQQSR